MEDTFDMSERLWNGRRLTELRNWYGDRVREHLGPHFEVDMSIPVAAAAWLVRFVVENKPRKIVEFGSGFSTLVFSRAMQSYEGGQLVSLDHDRGWLEFVLGCVETRGLPRERIQPQSIHRFWAEGAGLADGCQLVFVDHGPTYDARIAAVPPIIGLSRRVGCSVIVLDDWQKSSHRSRLYRRPVSAVIEECGLTVAAAPGSSLPTDSRELAVIEVS